MKNRFADYFVVCGLNSARGLEQNHIQNDNCDCLAPLERFYKSHLLKCYPDNETTALSDTDKEAVVMMCLPSGLKFRITSTSTAFHSFIITRKNATRLYGFSLVFYEKVSDVKICQALHTLQTMHVTEMMAEQKSNSHFVRNTFSRSLPRNFKLTTTNWRQVSDSNNRNSAYYDLNNDQLYVSKCIAIISQYSYVQTAKLFLQRFYEYVTMTHQPTDTLLSAESYLYNLLYEIEVPNFGQSLLVHLPPTNTSPVNSITILNSSNDQLPNFDYFLRLLFVYLDVDNVLKLFTCVLLEAQILLKSSDAEKLMTVAESITALIFPFEWIHVYVPILPMQMYHFLDAPVPFLMGLVTDTPSLANYYKSLMTGNLCVVDIDKSTIQCPEQIPNLPHIDEFQREIQMVLDHHGCLPLHKSQNVKKLHLNSNSLPNGKKGVQSLFEIVNLEKRPPSPPGSASTLMLQKMSNIVRKKIGDNELNTMQNDYLHELKINNAIRQVFVNRFVHLFKNFENFLICSNSIPQDGIENFDKVAFLSDQPDDFVPFLSRFLETQMFLNFIDHKLRVINSNENHVNRLFDLEIARVSHKSNLAYGYEPCTSIQATEQFLIEKLENADFESVPFPVIGLQLNFNEEFNWQFNDRLLNSLKFIKRSGSIPRINHNSISNRTATDANLLTLNVQNSNKNFIEKILKDFRIRTKRIVAMKLSAEGVKLTSNSQNSTNFALEENSQITSLCDYLERIWSHGLRRKMGKSALWSHLCSYQNHELHGGKKVDEIGGVFMKPVRLSKLTLRSTTDDSVTNPELFSLPNSLLYDLFNVQTMTDIKTHMGMVRAWIRLALEKKQLSKHLHTLLSNANLLKCLYKRSAFLRSDEEIEQFLYHIFSLNAVDFYSFTNSYTTTIIPYQMLILFGKKNSNFTSSIWIIVSGTLNETKRIEVNAQRTHFVFRHKNLGILTNLLIGLNDDTITMKWIIDSIVIRNEITGHSYKFSCGKSLGRDVDDGSTERLLIANRESDQISVSQSTMTANQLQNMLANCINRIMKNSVSRMESLTSLLCGNSGLVPCLELIFLYGFQSTRLFARNFYLWDYFLRVNDCFRCDEFERKDDNSVAKKYFCRLVNELETKTNSLGKDGKFQLFICLSVRDRFLHQILVPMAHSKATTEMFDESISFLCNRNLLTFLRQILQKLTDVDIVLDKSISHNICAIR